MKENEFKENRGKQHGTMTDLINNTISSYKDIHQKGDEMVESKCSTIFAQMQKQAHMDHTHQCKAGAEQWNR